MLAEKHEEHVSKTRKLREAALKLRKERDDWKAKFEAAQKELEAIKASKNH